MLFFTFWQKVVELHTHPPICGPLSRQIKIGKVTSLWPFMSVGRSVGSSQFSKWAGSYSFMLLSEHLFITKGKQTKSQVPSFLLVGDFFALVNSLRNNSIHLFPSEVMEIRLHMLCQKLAFSNPLYVHLTPCDPGNRRLIEISQCKWTGNGKQGKNDFFLGNIYKGWASERERERESYDIRSLSILIFFFLFYNLFSLTSSCVRRDWKIKSPIKKKSAIS